MNMTNDELDKMEQMWNEGCSGREIANALHYSPENIYSFAYRNRDRYPQRRPTYKREFKELWVSRVLSGRVSALTAARKAGICQATMFNWLREARKKKEEKNANQG